MCCVRTPLQCWMARDPVRRAPVGGCHIFTGARDLTPVKVTCWKQNCNPCENHGSRTLCPCPMPGQCAHAPDKYAKGWGISEAFSVSKSPLQRLVTSAPALPWSPHTCTPTGRAGSHGDGVLQVCAAGPSRQWLSQDSWLGSARP